MLYVDRDDGADILVLKNHLQREVRRCVPEIHTDTGRDASVLGLLADGRNAFGRYSWWLLDKDRHATRNCFLREDLVRLRRTCGNYRINRAALYQSLGGRECVIRAVLRRGRPRTHNIFITDGADPRAGNVSESRDQMRGALSPSTYNADTYCFGRFSGPNDGTVATDLVDRGS